MGTLISGHGSVSEPGQIGASQLPSKYCFMFPDLATLELNRPVSDNARYFNNLEKLAEIIDLQHSDGPGLSSLAAIYTYFGQFLNHDLSAPTATPQYLSSRKNSADKVPTQFEFISAGVDVIALMSADRPPSLDWLITNIVNQHPAPLCLNSLYGSGPNSPDPEIRNLYDPATMKFRLGHTYDEPQPGREQTELNKMLKFDLVRKGGVPKIADRRNDENVIIGQLHLAFMLFHNKAIDILKPKYPNPNSAKLLQLFNDARTLVTLHYQHCVFYDYLKHMVPDENAGSQLRLEKPNTLPFEFTTAAFRFGHSMISATYDYNRFFGNNVPVTPNASLGDLFLFTSRGRMGGSAGGVDRLPTHWVIDWARFVQPNSQGSHADTIDLKLPSGMAALGDLATVAKMEHGLASIAFRNLKRGYHRFMPSGQAVAAKLGMTPLSPTQIRAAFTATTAPAVLDASGFDRETPLWVYFLCEAKHAGGNKLGPAAGAIIRGTIREVLRQNPNSIFNYKGGSWKPKDSNLTLPNAVPIDSISRFLEFAMMRD